MLELHAISLKAADAPEARLPLHDVSAQIPEGHFCGIIGPPGTGKTALLEAAAGLRVLSSGTITWQERPPAPRETALVKPDGEIGERLTVGETIAFALRLRAVRRPAEIERLLAAVGLDEVKGQRVQDLDRAQRRRVALAAALAGSPPILLCDRLADGLDPVAEEGLLRTLRELAEKKHHLVIAAAQTVRRLAIYDSVMVLYGGMVAYHGPAGLLLHYFNLEHAEDLFPTLGGRAAADWYRSWLKHRAPYVERVAGATARSKSEQARIAELFAEFRKPGSLSKDSTFLGELRPVPPELPGLRAQTSALLALRWLESSRNGWEAACVLALALGGPLFVAWRVVKGGGAALEWTAGLLLVLGAANGAREIARRRFTLETESRAGVRPLAFFLSTLGFLAVLVAAQAAWAGLILRGFGVIAGGGAHVLWCAIAITAMSSIALAISSFARTADRAALYAACFVAIEISIYAASWRHPWTLFAAIAQGAASLNGGFDFQNLFGPLVVIKLHAALGFLIFWLGLNRLRSR